MCYIHIVVFQHLKIIRELFQVFQEFPNELFQVYSPYTYGCHIKMKVLLGLLLSVCYRAQRAEINGGRAYIVALLCRVVERLLRSRSTF